ncbi:hypothetical protein B0J13DRAFT_424476, partial [Dactylonectria estremocensis]
GCPAPALLTPGSLTWDSLKAQILWREGARGFASWSVTGWVLAHYLVGLVLFRVLPAKEVLGIKLRELGKPLRYRFNEKPFSSSVAQLVPCAIGTYIHGSDFFLYTWIVDNYLQLLTA